MIHARMQSQRNTFDPRARRSISCAALREASLERESRDDRARALPDNSVGKGSNDRAETAGTTSWA